MTTEIITKVYGKSATYEVEEVKGVFTEKYKLYKNGDCIQNFTSRADAVKKAHELAGPNAYEA